MKSLKNFIVISILSTIFLQGCATPQYETFHSYVPPRGAEAKSCLFQCSMTESQCEQLTQMRLDNCVARSQNKYDACEAREQASTTDVLTVADRIVIKAGVLRMNVLHQIHVKLNITAVTQFVAES